MDKISQRGERLLFDVLVVGSGAAGLSFCLELSKQKPDARIALITKNVLNESNSWYAQGGMAAVSLASDDFESHVKDTLKAGDGLCIQEAVEYFIRGAPEAIGFLQRLGVRFDCQDVLECLDSASEVSNPSGLTAGSIEKEMDPAVKPLRFDEHQATQENAVPDLTKEGGHSERRIYHVSDHTGSAVTQVLSKKVEALNNVTVFSYHTVVNLISNDEDHIPGSRPEVVGAYVLDEKQSLVHTMLANVVVLATGGAGKVYRYTSNPSVATGDGLAMAYRAGARVGNLEFYQFHPTVLYHEKLNNFLITEALRGEGAYLRLASGERFMARYAPEQMELATRDVVARAIFTELEHGEDKCVYLDIRHKPREFLEKHFATIYKTLMNLGIDMATDLIPVVPAAHYQCGGILADVHGTTDLRRLFVIGETAFTGLHGANRLASNSLVECVIMGRNAAHACQAWMEQKVVIKDALRDWESLSVVDTRRASQISAHWRGLRGEMTSYAGIVRTQEGLQDLLELLRIRREMIEDYYWQYTLTRDLIELRNITLVAELIVQAALDRKESRGCHYREDCK